ncbi:MAG: thioredoxin [Actinobacteria bacterium]|nr:thioredoxin [Actinomycetota bacterium]MCL5444572.1 thioredoxin [Actinomycetota bacterium]
MVDVTDATFEAEVIERSKEVPVVVDLWAPWCGPCKTLGPIIEDVVAETGGAVALAKVNVDENPQISAAFKVQSIPSVFAFKDGKAVDGFVGALPAAKVKEFVSKLSPSQSEVDRLVEEGVRLGDESLIREAFELEPGHVGAAAALVRLLIDDGRAEEALEVVARVEETDLMRSLAAEARLATKNVDVRGGDVDDVIGSLLDRVVDDQGAREEVLDLIEALPADDPRRNRYRKALAARLF